MEIIELKTLIDITDTGVRRINQGTSEQLNQYRNFITLNQCVELTSIFEHDAPPVPEDVEIKGLGFGSVFKGTHRVWTWRFYPDRAGAFASDLGPLGSLVATLDQVPIIKKLTETINIDKPVFELTDKRLTNTILKIISGTE
jgi:hypothetical protein